MPSAIPSSPQERAAHERRAFRPTKVGWGRIWHQGWFKLARKPKDSWVITPLRMMHECAAPGWATCATVLSGWVVHAWPFKLH